MRTSFYGALLLWFPFIAAAQDDPEYPTPPAAGNILRAEYFFDNDPGFGDGTPIAISPGVNLSGVDVDFAIDGLTAGIHRLHLRTLSQDGHWSVAFQREILVDADPPYPEPAAIGNIVKAEYFFDTDPGFGEGTDIPLTSGPDLADWNLEAVIAGLPSGSHRLFVRTLGEPGHWSVSYQESFLYDADPPYPEPTAPGDIVYAEYFVDNDPGFGEGIPITITSGTNLSDVPFEVDLTGLADNASHVLFLRTLDDWSVTYAVQFTRGDPLPVTLVDFRALSEAGTVQLYWQVVDEVDFEAYVIERSADARNFVQIGRQEALGNGGKTRYSFADTSPLSNQIGYYRLKMIDRAAGGAPPGTPERDRLDGTYSYSSILAVGNRSAGEMVVSPNPIGSRAYITFQSGTDQKIRMEMLGTDGKVMLSKDFDAVKGANRLEFQTEFLQQGVYIVRISGPDNAGAKRVIK